jgi:hypothetical protein
VNVRIWVVMLQKFITTTPMLAFNFGGSVTERAVKMILL